MMRSQHSLGSIWLRGERKITDMVLVAWLGDEQFHHIFPTVFSWAMIGRTAGGGELRHALEAGGNYC